MSKTRVRAIIELDGKILLVRNLSSPEFWCLPGGGVESGEDIVTAIRREIVEETGIEPVIGNVTFIHQFASDGQYEAPEFFFHIKNGIDYKNIDLASTTHGTLELAEIGFKDVTDINVMPEFLKTELFNVIEENFLGPSRIKIIG